jgi:osmotically-inducible protein OsmY
MLSGLALAAQVRVLLKDHEATRDLRIDIESRGDTVVLSGIVLNEQERAAAERVVTIAAGAGRIDNQLRLRAITRRFASAKT